MSLLPILYHTHHSLFAHDLPFWLALAGKMGGPILELGCGTGRVLQKIAEEGFPTFGLDLDMDMLVFCRSQLDPGVEHIPGLFLADMSAFHLDFKFPLIIMPCNTLSTLARSERSSTLKRVYEHLAPGGLFAAALPNPLALLELEEHGETELEEVFQHPLTGHPVQVSSQWERDKERFHVQWNYDLLDSEGISERLKVTTSHSLEPVSIHLEDLSQAGLALVDLYGGTDYSVYNEDSDDLLILAEKRSEH